MKEELENIGNELISDIRLKMARKGLDSSGDASDSLNAVVTGNKLEIQGFRYIGALQNGRRPGKQPPPEAMVEYVIEKPVTIENPTDNSTADIERVAFLIGRKIGLEGTEIYKDTSKGLELEDEQEKGVRLISDLLVKTAQEQTNRIISKIQR